MGQRGIIPAGREAAADDLSGALIRLNAKIKQMNRLLDRLLDDKNLTGAAIQALQVAEDAGRRGLRQCVLAEALELPAATVSRLVDTLVKNDLIRRSPHPTDRRVSMLELSTTGRDLLERRRSDYARLVEALPPAAAEALIAINPLLDLLDQALDQPPTQAEKSVIG